jgi:membrane protein DedA with SNARE-associated domain
LDVTSGLSSNLVGQYGYWGMALALVLNCLGVPIPSEVTLPLAGLAVEQGHWALWPTVLMAVGSQVVGLVIAYWLVRRGTEGEQALIHKIPHAHRLLALRDKLAARGTPLVFVTLLLPALHGLAGYAAGLAALPFASFLAVAVAGVTVWTLALMGVGYFASSHLDAIYHIFHSVGIVLVLLVIGAGVFWYSRRRV